MSRIAERREDGEHLIQLALEAARAPMHRIFDPVIARLAVRALLGEAIGDSSKSVLDALDHLLELFLDLFQTLIGCDFEGVDFVAKALEGLWHLLALPGFAAQSVSTRHAAYGFPRN
jgi:hypothetical protein